MLDLSRYETTVEGEKSLYKGIPIVYRYHPLVRKLMKSKKVIVDHKMVVTKSMQIIFQSILIQPMTNIGNSESMFVVLLKNFMHY